MNWKNAVAKEGNIYDIPTNWLQIHYYDALNILFRFENILRIFVYIVLKNKFGSKWMDCSIEENGKTIGTIEAIAKRRLSQENNMGYISYLIKCPIMQLTAGELVSLVLSESNWCIFKDHFSGSKEVIRSKLLEVIEVRNALAHFRPIKSEDVQLVKLNLNHLFMKIEKYLNTMTNINTVIPSNCSDKWYCSFNNISTEHCKVHAFESINKKWIRLSMVYESTILFEKEYRKNWNIRNLSLNTPQILKDYQSLCDNVIFITELVPNVNIKAEIGKIRKNINFTFSIESINKDEHISEGFTSLFQKIEEETAMIIEEITAQGKYVQSVQSKAVKYSDDGAWYFDDSGMKCEVSEDAVFEYWGDLSFDTEIISNTSKYPWMPLNITPDDDIPF